LLYPSGTRTGGPANPTSEGLARPGVAVACNQSSKISCALLGKLCMDTVCQIIDLDSVAIASDSRLIELTLASGASPFTGTK